MPKRRGTGWGSVLGSAVDTLFGLGKKKKRACGRRRHATAGKVASYGMGGPNMQLQGMLQSPLAPIRHTRRRRVL